MTDIIFCKPIHHYDSYIDLWSLVELSGFPIIPMDKVDITVPGVYITAPMNGDYREHMEAQIERQSLSGLPRMAHMIIWNLERPSGSAGSIGKYTQDNWDILHSRLADEVWVSDTVLADESGLRYVTLGSDYGLGELSDEKQYDFTHMSVEISRRVHIYKHFGDTQIGPNSWPPERDEILKKSRFALNVHQDTYPYCEPLRIALFAAYGLPIISETLASGHPYDEIKMHNYGGLVSGLKQALKDDYDTWRNSGLSLRERLCNPQNMQFGKMVKIAIEETIGTEWR